MAELIFTELDWVGYFQNFDVMSFLLVVSLAVGFTYFISIFTIATKKKKLKEQKAQGLEVEEVKTIAFGLTVGSAVSCVLQLIFFSFDLVLLHRLYTTTPYREYYDYILAISFILLTILSGYIGEKVEKNYTIE